MLYYKFLEEFGCVEEDEDCIFRFLKYLKEKLLVFNVCGMFFFYVCLNYFCFNNVEVLDGMVYGKGGVLVRVKRNIQKGEEIFIIYIDMVMLCKFRRVWFYKFFNFWCRCFCCQVEGDDVDVCIKCGKKVLEGKKFFGCGKCMKVWYCFVVCQKIVWKLGYKFVCLIEYLKILYG